MRPIPEIPSGVNVLLDSNVLVYALSASSTQCVELLRRCDTEELSGFTTVEVINEVCHRMMVAEAFGKGLVTKPSVSAVRGKKEIIRALREYWTQTARLLDSNLLILELNERRIRRAQQVRELNGLLSTDATIVAGALELGIDHLASNDADFDGIAGIAVFEPTDLPT